MEIALGWSGVVLCAAGYGGVVIGTGGFIGARLFRSKFEIFQKVANFLKP